MGTVIEGKKEILESKSGDLHLKFLQTLFVRDGESAFRVYKSIVINTEDNELRYQAAQKLYEYYYARGFYVTADNIRKQMGADNLQVVKSTGGSGPELPPLKYVLQVGAFSDKENARKLIRRFSGLDVTIMLKTKTISGRELHLVWIGPFNSRTNAERLAEKVRNDFQIEPKIKPMD
jgi:hypothetical protein